MTLEQLTDILHRMGETEGLTAGVCKDSPLKESLTTLQDWVLGDLSSEEITDAVRQLVHYVPRAHTREHYDREYRYERRDQSIHELKIGTVVLGIGYAWASYAQSAVVQQGCLLAFAGLGAFYGSYIYWAKGRRQAKIAVFDKLVQDINKIGDEPDAVWAEAIRNSKDALFKIYGGARRDAPGVWNDITPMRFRRQAALYGDGVPQPPQGAR